MNFEGNLQDLVGKTMLIGLTYYNQQEEIIEQKQLFGVISSANETTGVFAEVGEDKPRLIPPDPFAIFYAPRGIYTCLATEEEVTNPDFITSWRVIMPTSPEEPIDMYFNYTPLFNYIVPKEWKLHYEFDAPYCKQLLETNMHRFIDKDLLIGLTHFEVDGNDVKFIEQTQLYGTINRISYTDGIVVTLENGQEYVVPPDLTMLQSAAPGEYRLRSNGKIIEDPAFITMYSIYKNKTF